MARCTYTVPDKNISGDNLYGKRICNQPFIDWAWDQYNFDHDWWQGGWGFDDCCNTNKPLARTFNAIWALDYSSGDTSNDSYNNENMLFWGGRFVRDKIDGYMLRAKCGSNKSKIATTFGAGCTEYQKTVKWDCKEFQRTAYEDCSWECCDWAPCSLVCKLGSWVCKGLVWVTTSICILYGYIASWICTAGLETANAASQIKRIELYNTNFFYDIDVMQRASTLIHECRHIDGKAHDANFPSWAGGIAGQSGADSSWEYNGPYRWEVCWLAWYWAAAKYSSIPLREKARDAANSILGYAFAQRPSFTV
ncbi:MAG: hypothetical protein JO154_06740 [Chitinophaga sp.]|uniref:hypothetical protein n=1 Tax=Chitinophaga sp. TaxID=1869181 RepID=UPI0025C2F85F|nr:hypothetical protein [Chitinophaga sp.]MBV8252289.1 hypothetical protein [Chitinophaga sp.]